MGRTSKAMVRHTFSRSSVLTRVRDVGAVRHGQHANRHHPRHPRRDAVVRGLESFACVCVACVAWPPRFCATARTIGAIGVSARVRVPVAVDAVRRSASCILSSSRKNISENISDQRRGSSSALRGALYYLKAAMPSHNNKGRRPNT